MSRKTGKIKSNKTYLIVVEGQTEHQYFSEIKTLSNVHGINVRLKKSKHAQLEYILATAIKAANEEIQYDAIWCVYDYDVIEKGEISEKAKELKRHAEANEKISFAESLPSFEIWFLLHYTMPKKSYHDQDELIEELKGGYLPKYKKGTPCICSKLKNTNGSLELAIENSLKLVERNKNSQSKGDTFCNLYKIFKEIPQLGYGATPYPN